MKEIVIKDMHGDIYSDYILDDNDDDYESEHENDPYWDMGYDHYKFTPYGY